MSEQPEKKVSDIMIPIRYYKTISHSCTVRDVIIVLYRALNLRDKGGQGYQYVIVSDDYGNPVGLVTFRSVLQAIEPFFAKAEKLSIPVFWDGLFSQRCRAEAKKNIKDIMYPINVIAIESSDILIKAVHAMIKHKLGALPVKQDGCLVGMLRENELFEEVHSQVANDKSFEEIHTG